VFPIHGRDYDSGGLDHLKPAPVGLEEARKTAVAVCRTLNAAAVPHAIGGSLALALYSEPRPVERWPGRG
jgi:hypothetical protein